jgi:hypothetical protein
VAWLHSQPDDQIYARQTGPPQPELLAHDALEPIAVDRTLSSFADDQAQLASVLPSGRG